MTRGTPGKPLATRGFPATAQTGIGPLQEINLALGSLNCIVEPMVVYNFLEEAHMGSARAGESFLCEVRADRYMEIKACLESLSGL
jgi:hypothetical protein